MAPGGISRRGAVLAASAAMLADAGALAQERSMSHVVLLGDSVFDNGAYVGGGPDVVTQLRQQIPGGWRASLAAVDGGRLGDIPRQLRTMPADASHLVISIGGNDALSHAGIFEQPVDTVAEALMEVARVRQWFEAAYGEMLDQVLRLDRPTAVCTIYDTRYPEPRRTLAITALAVLNDGITRQAFRRGLPVVDLRLICNEEADFANPIEPSVQGGGKIAKAIATLLAQHDVGRHRSEIFV
jgi:hypothetical protein